MRQLADAAVAEASDQPFSWYVWEPRLRGKNADGEPSYSDELVPKQGTRRDFMVELRAAIEAYLPHWWDNVMMQRGTKVHEAHKDDVTGRRPNRRRRRRSPSSPTWSASST